MVEVELWLDKARIQIGVANLRLPHRLLLHSLLHKPPLQSVVLALSGFTAAVAPQP